MLTVNDFSLPQQSLSAADFERRGFEWDPDLHFAGTLLPEEVAFINDLVGRYGVHIVAHYVYSPLPKSYSVELQFAQVPKARQAVLDCLREYEGAFDEEGRLKAAT